MSKIRIFILCLVILTPLLFIAYIKQPAKIASVSVKKTAEGPTATVAPSTTPSPKPKAHKPTAIKITLPAPSITAAVGQPKTDENQKVLSAQIKPPDPSATPEPAANQIKKVKVSISNGSDNKSFDIEITQGMDVCGILEKAKNEGKINSLTIDDSYMEAFNSKYVKEINGFSDAWVFTVNGSSPLGCSLYKVNPDDFIEWKFP